MHVAVNGGAVSGEANKEYNVEHAEWRAELSEDEKNKMDKWAAAGTSCTLKVCFHMEVNEGRVQKKERNAFN